jgi:hypothetical protein
MDIVYSSDKSRNKFFSSKVSSSEVPPLAVQVSGVSSEEPALTPFRLLNTET